jgi:hypothetical protein
MLTKPFFTAPRFAHLSAGALLLTVCSVLPAHSETASLATHFQLSERATPPAINTPRARYPRQSAQSAESGWTHNLLFIDGAGEVVAVDHQGTRFTPFIRESQRTLARWQFETSAQHHVATAVFDFAIPQSQGRTDTRAHYFKVMAEELWPRALAHDPVSQRMLGEILLQLLPNQYGPIMFVDMDVTGPPSPDNLRPASLPLQQSVRLPAGDFTLTDSYQVEDIRLYYPGEALNEAQQAARYAKFQAVDWGAQHIAPGRYRVMAGDHQAVRPHGLVLAEVWRPRFWLQLAAENGDHKAQQRLALQQGRWADILIEAQDPFVQTWVGAKQFTRGDQAAGLSLLQSAADNDYAVAQAILDSVQAGQ